MKDEKVIDISEYIQEHTPHNVGELVCLKCLNRWTGVWPANVLLKRLACPYCKRPGYVILTGERVDEV